MKKYFSIAIVVGVVVAIIGLTFVSGPLVPLCAGAVFVTAAPFVPKWRKVMAFSRSQKIGGHRATVWSVPSINGFSRGDEITYRRRWGRSPKTGWATFCGMKKPGVAWLRTALSSGSPRFSRPVASLRHVN